MDESPELYAPARERRRPANWRLVLLRLWCVLGVLVALGVLTTGDGPLHFRAALFTLAGFYAVWQVVAWIFRPVLPPNDERR